MNEEMNWGDNSFNSGNTIIDNSSNQTLKGGGMENFNSPKKRKKFPIVFMGVLIVFLIVGVSSFYYFKILSAKNVFTILVDSAFDYMDSALENGISNRDSLVGNLSFKINEISSNDTEMKDLFDTFGKIDFSIAYGIDYNKKMVLLDLKSNFNGKKLINANWFAKEGTGYIYLEDIYDKYLSTSIDEYNSLFDNSYDYEAYRTVLNSFEVAVKGALREEYFTEEEVSIDGKMLHKTSLIVNNDNYNTFKSDVINSLLNDEEFLREFASIMENEIENVKELLENSLEDEEEVGNGTISIYTDGLKVAMFDIVSDEGAFSVTIEDNTYNFVLYENEKLIFDGYVKTTTVGEQVTIDVKFTEYESGNLVDLTVVSSTDSNGRVREIDTSNSVDFEKISDEDMMEISSNLFKSEGLMELFLQIYDIDFENSFSSYIWEAEDSI